MITLIDDKTYKIKNCGDVPAKIVIGGNNKDKFIPNLNVGYYFGGGEEYYDNLNRTDKITTSKSDLRFDGSKITLIEGGDIDEIYTDGQGRLKWDVVFESCPESMTLEWKRKCSNGLTAHYQDTLENDWLREPMGLSLEEYLATHHRPDDVIGSYAIYCDKAHNYIKPVNKKKEIPANWKAQLSDGAALADLNIDSYQEYKTGKVGHSYRPFVVDANGKKEWCVMLFVGNTVQITLPEEFMKSAVYPVRLDPTIGYTSAGGSAASANYTLYSGKYNIIMPENGTASKIYAYISCSATGYAAYLGYYSGSSEPSTLVDGNKSVTISSLAATWYSASVSGDLASGSKYYPSVLSNPAGSGSNRIYVDSGSAGDSCYIGSVSTMPSSYGTPTSSTYRRTFYIEYTVTSSGQPAASRLRNISRNPYVRYH